MPRKPAPQKSRPKPRHVAAFGAALTTLAAAPAAQGSVISLTISPATNPFQAATSGTARLIRLRDSGGTVFALGQANDSYGKALFGLFRIATQSVTVSPSSAFGNIRIISNAYLQHNTSLLSGTHTFAFKTGSNQVGWLRIDMGGIGNDIHYLAAAYENTPGMSIHVGDTGVPEPATGALAGLGLLAIGANEIRRRRKAAAAKANAAS